MGFRRLAFVVFSLCCRFLLWAIPVAKQKLVLARASLKVWEGYAMIVVIISMLVVTKLLAPVLVPVIVAGDLEASQPNAELSDPPILGESVTVKQHLISNAPTKTTLSVSCEPATKPLIPEDFAYWCQYHFQNPSRGSESDGEFKTPPGKFEPFLSTISSSDTLVRATWIPVNSARQQKSQTVSAHDIGSVTYSSSDTYGYNGNFWLISPPLTGQYKLRLTLFPGKLNDHVALQDSFSSDGDDRTTMDVVRLYDDAAVSKFELQKVSLALSFFVFFSVLFTGLGVLATLFNRISAKADRDESPQDWSEPS